MCVLYNLQLLTLFYIYTIHCTGTKKVEIKKIQSELVNFNVCLETKEGPLIISYQWYRFKRDNAPLIM